MLAYINKCASKTFKALKRMITMGVRVKVFSFSLLAKNKSLKWKINFLELSCCLKNDAGLKNAERVLHDDYIATGFLFVYIM